jgi:hypothetical protein
MIHVGGSIVDWRTRYANLSALPAKSTNGEKRRRGKEFESVLRGMFAEAAMEPRTAFRPKGEEIDGSFLHQGRPMLFEAKWTSKPVPASTLYQFRAKLEGKLVGTLGAFISIGGYSDDAVDALVAGKSLNMVLFDKDDMDKLARPHCIDIRRALDLKLRAAAERGTPYVQLPPCADKDSPDRDSRLIIVVEGTSDAAIIGAMLQARKYPTYDIPLRPMIIAARGLLNLPLVTLAQISLYPEAQRIVIVANGDGRSSEVRRQINDALREEALPSEIELVTVVIDSTLEESLGVAKGETRPERLFQAFSRLDTRQGISARGDLRRLLEILGLWG